MSFSAVNCVTIVRPLDGQKQSPSEKRISTGKSPGAPNPTCRYAHLALTHTFVFARGIPASGGKLCPASSARNSHSFIFLLFCGVPAPDGYSAPSTPVWQVSVGGWPLLWCSRS